MSKGIGKLLPFWSKGKKKDPVSSPDADDMQIGLPTSVQHTVHVGFDQNTGEFEGLPGPWKSWLDHSNIRYTIGLHHT